MGLFDFFKKDNKSLIRFTVLNKQLDEKNIKLIEFEQFSESELNSIINILNEIIGLIENKAISLTNKDIRQFYLLRGNAFTVINEYQKSTEDYKNVIKLVNQKESDFDLHYLKAYDGLSWNQARLGKYSEALKNVNELIAYAIKSKNLLPKFFIVRSVCYKELGNLPLSERSMAISQLNPMLLDQYFSQEGDEALQSGFTAIGYNNLGSFCFAIRQFDEALKYYSKATELNPKYSKAYYNIGVIYTEKKLHNNAIEEYTKSINIEKNNTKSLLNRGNEYCYVGNFSAAIIDYETCLRLEPFNSIAEENLQYARAMSM